MAGMGQPELVRTSSTVPLPEMRPASEVLSGPWKTVLDVSSHEPYSSLFSYSTAYLPTALSNLQADVSDAVTIPKCLEWNRCATRGQVEHGTIEQYPELGTENPFAQHADREAAGHLSTGCGSIQSVLAEPGVKPVSPHSRSSSQQNRGWRGSARLSGSLSILLMPSTG